MKTAGAFRLTQFKLALLMLTTLVLGLPFKMIRGESLSYASSRHGDHLLASRYLDQIGDIVQNGIPGPVDIMIMEEVLVKRAQVNDEVGFEVARQKFFSLADHHKLSMKARIRPFERIAIVRLGQNDRKGFDEGVMQIEKIMSTTHKFIEQADGYLALSLLYAQSGDSGQLSNTIKKMIASLSGAGVRDEELIIQQRLEEIITPLIKSGQHVMARDTLEIAYQRLQTNGILSVKMHVLPKLVALKIVLTSEHLTHDRIWSALALRDTYLKSQVDNADDISVLTRKFAFYTVRDLCGIVIAYARTNNEAEATRYLGEAIDLLKHINVDDQVLAWGQVVRAAAATGRIDLAPKGVTLFRNGEYGEDLRGDVFEALVARNNLAIADQLSVTEVDRVRLAEALVAHGHYQEALSAVSSIALDHVIPEQLRPLAEAHCRVYGATPAVEWSKQWKKQSLRAYSLLGVVDGLVVADHEDKATPGCWSPSEPVLN